MTPLSSLLVGKLAVQAALESGNRRIYRLFLSNTLPPKRAEPFHQAAASLGVTVEGLTPADLVERTGVQNHGGVAAEVGPRVLSPFEEWVRYVEGWDHAPLLFAFEKFHEPHNLGYALRCVEALGADAVLMDRREWGEDDVVIGQSSSGAYDRLPLAALDDPTKQFKRLETLGIESLLATAGAMRNFYDFNLRAPVLIAVGGEFKGLTDAVRNACRHSAHLPMADPIPSFPAGHAAAILASEVARQRRMPGPPGPLWPGKRPIIPAKGRAAEDGSRQSPVGRGEKRSRKPPRSSR
ncbi:MAG: hypothetical protein KY468_11010 [Armatimonadetes bacterium]|nr:hypothetical protein [Armatimonadota bacterium]